MVKWFSRTLPQHENGSPNSLLTLPPPNKKRSNINCFLFLSPRRPFGPQAKKESNQGRFPFPNLRHAMRSENLRSRNIFQLFSASFRIFLLFPATSHSFLLLSVLFCSFLLFLVVFLQFRALPFNFLKEKRILERRFFSAKSQMGGSHSESTQKGKAIDEDAICSVAEQI